MWNIFRKLVRGNKIAFNPVHSPWNLHLCTFFFQNKTIFEVFMHLLEIRKWKRIFKQLVAKLFENFLHCSIIFFTSSPANICWSWRRLQNVFSVTILRLPRHLENISQDVLKTSWRHVLKTSWRHYGDKHNTYWRYLHLTNLNACRTNLYLTNLHF